MDPAISSFPPLSAVAALMRSCAANRPLRSTARDRSDATTIRSRSSDEQPARLLNPRMFTVIRPPFNPFEGPLLRELHSERTAGGLSMPTKCRRQVSVHGAAVDNGLPFSTMSVKITVVAPGPRSWRHVVVPPLSGMPRRPSRSAAPRNAKISPLFLSRGAADVIGQLQRPQRAGVSPRAHPASLSCPCLKRTTTYPRAVLGRLRASSSRRRHSGRCCSAGLSRHL